MCSPTSAPLSAAPRPTPSLVSTLVATVDSAHPASFVEEIIEETIKQTQMLWLDRDAFFDYAKEFSQACITSNYTLNLNLANCSKNLITYVKEVHKYNLSQTVLNDNQLVKERVLSSLIYSRKLLEGSRGPLHITVNRLPLSGEVLDEDLLRIVCAGLDPQPSTCRSKSIIGIRKRAEEEFSSHSNYPYSGVSVYLTIVLTMIFILYILSLLAMQAIFAERNLPSYVPMSVVGE